MSSLEEVLMKSMKPWLPSQVNIKYRPGQANVQFSLCDLVYKFCNFSTAQNLREIDFGDCTSENLPF